MIGQTLGHYRVLEQIGAGGMGVVFRARDQRLDRDVALKVLPPGKLDDDLFRKRFRNEAQALAKLNHPNIGAIYDFNAHEGVDFLAMEYIPGETLSQRLAKGTLPDKALVSVAIQIVSALEEAHEHGIVHQDLKPGNIMLTPKGQVKVLDFGLARLLDAEAGQDITATLLNTDGAGTLPYMSPEQLRGDAVDTRSDIFSLGVVLYELSAGQRPFQEEPAPRLIQQILAEAPRPLRDWNHRVSPQLESIVSKALDKQPSLRYQSARELRVDLERLASPASSTTAPLASPNLATSWRRTLRAHSRGISLGGLVLVVALVVLWWFAAARPVLSFAPRDWLLISDFDNQTGDPLFDRSLFTALTVSLEQSAHANIVPRARIDDALRRMGKPADERITEPVAREISMRENFRAVLSCSIGRVGQQYVFTARLVDPQNGVAVRSYIEQSKDQDHVLEALGTVASHVRRDLGETMLATTKSDRPLPYVTTASLQALKMYADANLLWSRGEYSKAEQLYLSAIQIDPEFAMAHAALGGVYYSHLYNNPVRGKEHYQKALQLSERTSERERLFIETHYAQDLGHFNEASDLFAVYFKSYPDDWTMRANYGNLLRRNGQAKEALDQYRELVRISPNNASVFIDLATCYGQLGDFDNALLNYEKAFGLDPSWETNANINNEYGMTLFRHGDEEKARAAFKLAFDKPSLKPRGLRSLAWLDLYHGKYEAAKSQLHEALLSDEAFKWPLSVLRERNILAIVAEGQGDRAGRLRELDLAFTNLAKVGPQVRPSLWLGSQYARGGNAVRAAEILEKARPLADPQNAENSSDIHTLEGEVELARGHQKRAIELFLLADKVQRTPMTLEALARAYEVSGNAEQAATWYETMLSVTEDPVGWEPQQDWLAAHYRLARIYFTRGDTAKASARLAPFLTAWKEADAALPLLKDARRLRDQIAAKP